MKKLQYPLLFSLLLNLFLILPVQAADNSEALLELFQRIDSLGKEVRTLRGENERLQHQVERMKKTQKRGFLGVDDRIDSLAKRIKAKPVVTPKPKRVVTQYKKKPAPQRKPVAKTKPSTKANSVKTPESKIKDSNIEEKKAYQRAYQLLKKKSPMAFKAFQDYIKQYSGSPLAANAQYWLGEIRYSQKNYKGAVDEFVKVLQEYKKSDKAPDAAIKLGFSFYELKNWVYARRALEDVVRYFPKTNAANLAKRRLAKMKINKRY
ncbi:MAG: tol-pal system protein YbgF [Cocleimonas sp.]|nr:tol-pal system protein YbgF [Cocleimonas sp.]